MSRAHRLGIAPADRSEANRSTDAGACPDILLIPDPSELDLQGTEGMRDGPVYAVIGTLATEGQIEKLALPDGASVAAYEAVVFIPEEVLRAAAEALLLQRADLTAVATSQAQ